MNDKVIKAMGKAYIANFLLESVCKVIKEDNVLYKFENKYLINRLLKINKDIFKQNNQIREGTHKHLKDLNKEDLELSLYETDDELEIIESFCNIYQKLNKDRLADVTILFNELLSGRLLYTLEDVRFKMRLMYKDLKPDEEPSNDFINNYI